MSLLDCLRCGRRWPRGGGSEKRGGLGGSCSCAMGPSQGFGPGRHTRLWLELSWCLGDEHAHRICRIIDWYVRIFRLRGRSWWSSPGGAR
jgi:hypothetical protein